MKHFKMRNIYIPRKNEKRDRQCTCNVVLRCVRVTIVAVEKHTFCVCVCVCVCLFSCLSYPACKLHLFCTILYCHLWPVWLYRIFPHYLIKGEIFRKQITEHQRCVLIFFTMSEKNCLFQEVSKTVSEMCIGLHVKYPLCLSDLTKLDFSWQIFEKFWNIKFHENPCRGFRGVPCIQTDRQTRWG